MVVVELKYKILYYIFVIRDMKSVVLYVGKILEMYQQGMMIYLFIEYCVVLVYCLQIFDFECIVGSQVQLMIW